EEAHLRAREAVGSEEEELAAARAPHPEAEQLVRLLVEEIVGGGAEAVPPEPVRTLGVVFGDVEERGASRRPRHRADFFGAVGKHLPREEILHVERVLTEAGNVDRIGEPTAVVADRIGAEYDG